MDTVTGEITVKPGESLGNYLSSVIRYFGTEDSYVLVQIEPYENFSDDTYLFRTPKPENVSHKTTKTDEIIEVRYDDEFRKVKRIFMDKGDFDESGTGSLAFRWQDAEEIKRPLSRGARIQVGESVHKFLSRTILYEMDI